MTKKILIISSSPKNDQIPNNLLKQLAQRGYKFYLLSAESQIISFFKENKWPSKKIYILKVSQNFIKSFLQILIFPLFFIYYLTAFLYYKQIKKFKVIILNEINEKIFFTAILKITGLKPVWIEWPGKNNQKHNKILNPLYKFSCKLANLIIAFSSFTKNNLLSKGIEEEKIKIIPPGIDLEQFQRQDTIFDKIAQTEGQEFKKKYFTIGVVADLNEKQKIENIFGAIKISLNLIPEIQLIIIGDGKERKGLIWLAKKMKIDTLVWFVGNQKYLKKWLDSFDIFVVPTKNLTINDFDNILKAMNNELPIIGPVNTELDDIIEKNKNGSLIEIDNSEMLARNIIKLYQDKNLRIALGKNSKDRAVENFQTSNMIQKFESILQKLF